MVIIETGNASGGGAGGLDEMIIGEFKSANIETAVADVRAYAFYNVSNINMLTFTIDVASVGVGAFENFMPNDNTIHFKSTIAPNFDGGAFGSGMHVQNITVPEEAVQTYEQALQGAGISDVTVSAEV